MKTQGGFSVKVFFRYSIFGAAGVFSDFLIFAGLVALHVPYVGANAVGHIAGTSGSFILNRNLNFRVFDKWVRRFLIFFGVSVVGLIVSTALLWSLVEFAALTPIAAKILVLPLVLVIQFFLNNFFTFKRRVPEL